VDNVIRNFQLTQGEDFFIQLFIGAGAPIGFLIIAVFTILMIVKVKESAIISIPISFIMGLYLMNELPQTDFMWYICIMYFILGIGLSLITANALMKGE
jgi:hypothetical protein